MLSLMLDMAVRDGTRYSHVFDDHAEDVADAMDALLSPPTRGATVHQIGG